MKQLVTLQADHRAAR